MALPTVPRVAVFARRRAEPDSPVYAQPATPGPRVEAAIEERDEECEGYAPGVGESSVADDRRERDGEHGKRHFLLLASRRGDAQRPTCLFSMREMGGGARGQTDGRVDDRVHERGLGTREFKEIGCVCPCEGLTTQVLRDQGKDGAE